MVQSLEKWILELRDRFETDELEKQVIKATVTVGLVDPKSREVQYHTLEYTAKKE